ncbi:MAG TPA: metallophosphoesterase family protein [Gaiellaceae bacterium]|nr:metallophosphoesterase family protein [Gaiellaceae bacterium]
MNVAALYDVHGMPWALEAVLLEAQNEADAIVFGGDFTYGPYPRETLERVRALDAIVIRGNCERDPVEWDLSQLTPEQVEWMQLLPMTAEIDGVLFCHATPTDDMPITVYTTPDDVIAANFAGVTGTVVIGHTHHQFDRHVGGLRVVNAGAVGMPYEGEVAAFWTMLVDGEPQFRKTPFDIENAKRRVAATAWPSADGFVEDNLGRGITRDEAIAGWEGRR